MVQIDLKQMLPAFSLALDIAENQPMEHAQRTAYIALQIGKQLGLSGQDMQDIYIAALLHDVGVTHSKVDAHIDNNQLMSHCFIGRDIVTSLPFISKKIGENIAWHHANWDGNGVFERQGHEIPIGAQIIYLADKIDIQLGESAFIYSKRATILNYVMESSGKLFNPEVVEGFLAVQSREKFWLDYSNGDIIDVISNFSFSTMSFDLANMEVLALAFARIIDNKSPFTHYHSQGVAELVSGLGSYYGFDVETIQTLKISGLLHDLGKLSVPNDILDKPGQLSPIEYQVVKGHSYYTKRILSKITGFEQIKEWAGNHHETLDGKGYPEGLGGDRLSLQDKIVAVCDIYQALTEERPYRVKPLAQSKVFDILDEQAQKNKICQRVLSSLKKMIG